VLRVARDFFDLPAEEKAKYESGGEDPLMPLLGRSRTTKDGHHSWRDLFRHRVAPVSDAEIEDWPAEPECYRLVILNNVSCRLEFWSIAMNFLVLFQSLIARIAPRFFTSWGCYELLLLLPTRGVRKLGSHCGWLSYRKHSFCVV
jgi:hypothetical protein